MALKDTANFANIPSAYRTGITENSQTAARVYSIKPSATIGNSVNAGDLVYRLVSRNHRYNSMGMLKEVGQYAPALNYRIANGRVCKYPEFQLSKARTNVLKYTYNFSSLWNATGVNIGSDVTDSINVTGIFGVNKLLETASTGDHLIAQSLTGLTIGRNYVFSLYVKPVGRQAIRIQLANASDDVAIFDLSNASISKTDADLAGGNKARIEVLPNGWFRISSVFTPTTTTSTIRIVLLRAVGGAFTTSYTGETNKGFLIYGAQLESNTNGSATDVSPYIKTLNTNMTRQTPVLYSKPNFTNSSFTDNILPFPYSVYWEGQIDRYASQQIAWSLGPDFTSSTDHYTALVFNSDTNIKIKRQHISIGPTTNNTEQVISYRTTKFDYLKILVVFENEQDASLFINGFKIASFSSLTNIESVAETIRIGSGLNTAQDTGQRQSYNQIFLWLKAFTDTEAVSVTSYDNYDQMAESSNFKIA